MNNYDTMGSLGFEHYTPVDVRGCAKSVFLPQANILSDFVSYVYVFDTDFFCKCGCCGFLALPYDTSLKAHDKSIACKSILSLSNAKTAMPFV